VWGFRSGAAAGIISPWTGPGPRPRGAGTCTGPRGLVLVLLGPGRAARGVLPAELLNGKWLAKSNGVPWPPGVGEAASSGSLPSRTATRVDRRGDGEGGTLRPDGEEGTLRPDGEGGTLRARLRGDSATGGGGSGLRFRRGLERIITGGAGASEDGASFLPHSSRGRICLCWFQYSPHAEYQFWTSQ
jgi:hypothetical protein